MKYINQNEIQVKYSKINRTDKIIVILIYTTFLVAASIQFTYIAKLPIQVSNYTMPMIMSTIFSIIVIVLRRLRRTLNQQLFNNVSANQEITKLNQELSTLLAKRTLLLHEARDQIALAQIRSDLGALASGVIHDLSNALMLVEQNFLLSQESEDPQEKNEVLNDMQLALTHAKELTGSFKSLVRPNKKQQVNLYDLLKKLYPLLQKLFVNLQELHLILPSDFSESPYIVLLSEVQMTQVIMNLVINARDALDKQAGEVTIQLRKKDDIIQLVVSDTGMGMSDEIQSKIFQAFFTSKPNGKGTGLGLHVLKQTIDLIHGKIDIESQIQYGSTFYISMPNATQENLNLNDSITPQQTPPSSSDIYDFWS
jgi:signal transduction histidine kinase